MRGTGRTGVGSISCVGAGTAANNILSVCRVVYRFAVFAALARELTTAGR